MSIKQNYLLNLISQLIDSKLADVTWKAIGVVTAVDEANYLVRVRLHYENFETDWIRISTGYAGNGFGEKSPIAVNDEVVVSFYSGTMASGYVSARLYNNPNDLPPVSGSGDYAIIHKSGSKFILKAGGDVQFLSSSGVNLELKSDGSFQVVGAGATIAATATGQIQIKNSTTELISDIVDLLGQLVMPENVLSVLTPPVATAVGGFNPGVLAALEAIQAKLQTLKV